MSFSLPVAGQQSRQDARLFDLGRDLGTLERGPSSAGYMQLHAKSENLHGTYKNDPVFKSLMDRLEAVRVRIESSRPQVQNASLQRKTVTPIKMTVAQIAQRVAALEPKIRHLLVNDIGALRSEYIALAEAVKLLPKNPADPTLNKINGVLWGLYDLLSAVEQKPAAKAAAAEQQPAGKPFLDYSKAKMLGTILNMAASYYHENKFLPAMLWGAGIQLAVSGVQREPANAESVVKKAAFGAVRGLNVAVVNGTLGGPLSYPSIITQVGLGVASLWVGNPSLAKYILTDAQETGTNMMQVQGVINMVTGILNLPSTIYSYMKHSATLMTVGAGIGGLGGLYLYNRPQN